MRSRCGFLVVLRRPFSSSQTVRRGLPKAQGLYDPSLEKDSCGVGALINLKKKASHSLVENALTILERMHHRGGAGAESNTGDGAGILLSTPHDFLTQAVSESCQVRLPDEGKYGTGIWFFSKEQGLREECQKKVEKLAESRGLKVLAWRTVPTENSNLGQSSLACEPFPLMPILVSTGALGQDQLEIELILLRRLVERELVPIDPEFYPCSLSTRTIVYKGMLTASQLRSYFLDFDNKTFASYLALVHSRFSTNTFPSWARAQPMRMLCHNGEINTLRGNINWMKARESKLKSSKLQTRNISDLLPVIDETQSDSGCFDNALEALFWASESRTLPQCMLMMIPEPWQKEKNMDSLVRSFYRYNANIMEPWDGPAMMAFTDGRIVGATLDRNGLRPSRIYRTGNDEVVIASEVGTLSEVLKRSDIVEMGRLVPGQIFVADLEQGRIVRDKEVKSALAQSQPYSLWCEEIISMDKLRSLAVNAPMKVREVERVVETMAAYGYTQEIVEMALAPMALTGKEGLGSMGNDAALAVLSTKPRSVFEYFKQLFAQVTNPPIDPIRESCVMSITCPVGPSPNLFDAGPQHARRIELDQPLLSPADASALKLADIHGLRCKEIDCLVPYSPTFDGNALRDAISSVANKAAKAAEEGFTVICLTDRPPSASSIPLPSLATTAAVHHHLLKLGLRTQVILMVESGDANQISHLALLFGYGADCVHPHMLYDAVWRQIQLGYFNITEDESVGNIQHAFDYGLRKIMAKMGISTLQSYKGAQIFEAVGLGKEIISTCFPGTPSRIGGISFSHLATDILTFHQTAYPKLSSHAMDPGVAWYTSSARLSYARAGIFDTDGRSYSLPTGGDFHYRDGGEMHYNDPSQMVLLQQASKRNSRESYEKYKQVSLDLVKGTCVRGRMELVEAVRPLPIESVEPAHLIVRRFTTGAMSLGAISKETHEALAVAMNKIDAKSNTGEGGEDSGRFGTERESAIKQIASGRFGVTINYLTNAKQLQIKMAQGAKPGEGGELPGDKVTIEIAQLRNSVPGVGLISPPPHHDIYSIEDLAQLIFDLKNSNPQARVSVKLVSEVGVGVVAAGVAKAKADHILLSGHDGGTGAAMWSGIKSTGLPWELGLAEVQQTLVLNDLRGRVILECDGQMKTGFDVTVGFLLGAEEIGFSTAPLIALGCIMMRKCHLNTCPVGIATQDPILRQKFAGSPEHVINFLFLIAEDVRSYMAQLGVRTVSEMIGRSDLLRQIDDDSNSKAASLDISRILLPSSQLRPGAAILNTSEQQHDLHLVLDNHLLSLAQKSIDDSATRTEASIPIFNTNRTVGTMLSHKIAKKYGAAGLPTDTITFNFTGSTGQSFGAFLIYGVTFIVHGDSNDGMGKGLSGGIISLSPDSESPFEASQNVIVGNACGYGATAGSVFIAGTAGERFAVRNSGATFVVEGVGDHPLEYMTGGEVVILGSVGRNVAAGMSGGRAWVYDPSDSLEKKMNGDEPERRVEVLGSEFGPHVRSLIEEHVRRTGSELGSRILNDWTGPKGLSAFKQITPLDFERALEKGKREKSVPSPSPPPPATRTQKRHFSTGPPSQKFTVSARGFLEIERSETPYRDPIERLGDYNEVSFPKDVRVAEDKITVTQQAKRCMNCGTPFCHTHSGCPLNNLIPDFNGHATRNNFPDALDSLLKTNPFPEFTGRVCPAPCESACVAGLITDPVAIKSVELSIAEWGFNSGNIRARPPKSRSNMKIAIVGSGPAGLAAADELNQMGHNCVVFEKNEYPGGLLMYGIPNMKIDKRVVHRRIKLLQDEGVTFSCNTTIQDVLSLKNSFDAVLLAIGAEIPRTLPIEGHDAKNINFAMDFLRATQTQLLLDNPQLLHSFDSYTLREGKREYEYNIRDWDSPALISAKGKHVVVIGGGDTGTDCVATAVRHGAASVSLLELMPRPPNVRSESNAWPDWARVFHTDYGHAEAIQAYGSDARQFAIMSQNFVVEDGAVKGIKVSNLEFHTDTNGRRHIRPIPDSEKIIPADLVLLALGFQGPDGELVGAGGVELNSTMCFKASYQGPQSFRSNLDSIFVAGDCRRGQSLIVWAISEGRRAAASIDRFLHAKQNL